MDRRAFLAAATLAGLCPSLGFAQQPQLDPENTLYMDLKDGCRVTIRLRPDLAPKHVAQVKTLVRQGFYNGLVFHRVIEGFMAQGGDPTGTGTGGSKLPNLPLEANRGGHFLRGAVGAARSNDPNSANSQFFIMFAPNQGLDDQYTVWGQVVQGMECVDKIKRGAPGSGTVADPDRIVRMQVAADARG